MRCPPACRRRWRSEHVLRSPSGVIDRARGARRGASRRSLSAEERARGAEDRRPRGPSSLLSQARLDRVGRELARSTALWMTRTLSRQCGKSFAAACETQTIRRTARSPRGGRGRRATAGGDVTCSARARARARPSSTPAARRRNRRSCRCSTGDRSARCARAAPGSRGSTRLEHVAHEPRALQRQRRIEIVALHGRVTRARSGSRRARARTSISSATSRSNSETTPGRGQHDGAVDLRRIEERRIV